ncbi:hypothetical protein FB451DRAFT_1415381 [Mycena latifolia]|nr:hypothetical protein FB451DRAFT_1415381 [Mycena latifolia]
MDDAQLVASIAVSALLEYRSAHFPPTYVAANPALFVGLDWVLPRQLRAWLKDRPASSTRSHADSEGDISMIAVGTLFEFRAETIPPAFITANPGGFVNLDWVHKDALRAFLRARNPGNSMPSTHVFVKTESSELSSLTHVKSEIVDLSSLPASPVSAPVKTVTLVEHDIEIIEILSSEDEMEVEVSLRPSGTSPDPPEPSQMPEVSDSDDASPDLGVAGLSDMVWYDTNIISRAIDGLAHINRQTKVERVEYLNDLPSYWPVPRVPTAYVVDLRDPKFDFLDSDGELLRADALILDKDQDSWDTTLQATPLAYP